MGHYSFLTLSTMRTRVYYRKAETNGQGIFIKFHGEKSHFTLNNKMLIIIPLTELTLEGAGERRSQNNLECFPFTLMLAIWYALLLYLVVL